MTSRTAKLFKIGRHQFVLLPKSFNFEGDRINIRQNSVTGEIILFTKPKNWDGFIEAANAIIDFDDFMDNRIDEPPL